MTASVTPTRTVSAVITTFHDGDLLQEALQSVVNQHVAACQVIVIDDGSEPRTAPDIIERIQKTSGVAIQYHWAENGGPSQARNRGLALAEGEWIAYLDADDRWLPEHLALKLDRIESLDADYSTVYDGFVEFDGTTGSYLPTIELGSYHGPISGAPLGLPGGPPAGMQFQLHRTSALREVGGFDPDLRVNEDFDLLLRLGKAGYKMAGSPRVTVERRVHPNSLTRIDPVRTLKDLETFLQKAEDLDLLPPAAIASKRKWGHISLAKAMLSDQSYSSARVLAQFRAAFACAPPSGAMQRSVKTLAGFPPIGVPAIWMARWVQRSRMAR